MDHIKRAMVMLTILVMFFSCMQLSPEAAAISEESGIISENQTETDNTGEETRQQEDTEGNGELTVKDENDEQNDEAEQNTEETIEEKDDGNEETGVTGLEPGTSIPYTSKKETTGASKIEIVAFSITKDGKTYDGACSQIGVKALGRGTAKVSKVPNTSRHAKLVYKYAIEKGWWRGPEGEQSAKGELGANFSVKTTKRKLVEHMNQICVQGSSWKKAAVDGGGMTSSFANTLYRYVTGLDVNDVVVPDSFELYYCDAGSGQNFSVWRYTKGEITFTSAKDSKSGSSNIVAAEKEIIVDTVRYSDLSTSENYTVVAEVYDKTAGKMLDSSAKVDFTPDSASGDLDMQINVDTSGLEGHTLVVYETLMSDGNEISSHKDPENRDQTLYIPEISTTAEGAETGSHMAGASEETVIRDVIEYKNLIPGETYQMRGTLMDKGTGKQLEPGGEPVTASISFVPGSANGSVELTFSFDGKGSAGKTAVVFEECVINETVIASHRDINDEKQTVHFPSLSTEAGFHVDGFVIDNVRYENLVPGMTYKVKGCLIDKRSGKTISGSEGEVSFTPETAEGIVEVMLDPGEAKGELVAFETLYLIAEGGMRDVSVAEHKDMGSESQTVTIGRSVPETGDHSILHVWIACMITAGAGLTFSIVKRLRNTTK